MKNLFLAVVLALAAGAAHAQALPSTNTRAVPTYESAGLYWSSPGRLRGTGCEVKYRRAGDARLDAGPRPVVRRARQRVPRQPRAPRAEHRLRGGAQPAGPAGGARALVQDLAQPAPGGAHRAVASGSATLNITAGGTPRGYVVYEGARARRSTRQRVAIQRHRQRLVRDRARLHAARARSSDAIRISPNVTRRDHRGQRHQRLGPQRATATWAPTRTPAIRAVCQPRRRSSASRSSATRSTTRATAPTAGPTATPRARRPSPSRYCGGNHVIRHNEIYSTNGNYFNDVIGGEDNFSTDRLPQRRHRHLRQQHLARLGRRHRGRGRQPERAHLGQLHRPAPPPASPRRSTSVGPLYIFRNVYNRSRVLEQARRSTRTTASRSSSRAPMPSFGNGRRYVFHNTMLQATRSGAVNGLGGGARHRRHGQPASSSTTPSRSTTSTTCGSRTSPYYQVGTDNDFANDMYNGSTGTHGGQRHQRRRRATRRATAGRASRAASTSSRRARPGLDHGVRIANFNDGFTGAAPDVGAHEAGAPAP